MKSYHSLFNIPIFPFASSAGIDAELRLAKEDFETLVNDIKDKQTLFRLLYYFDVENLIGTLQNAVLETKYIVADFYRTLNNNSFLVYEDLTVLDDGMQYASGYVATSINLVENSTFKWPAFG